MWLRGSAVAKPVVVSPAKVVLLEGVYPPGTSATAATVTSAKLASLSGVEGDAAYDVLVVLVAEQRALGQRSCSSRAFTLQGPRQRLPR